MVPSSRRERYLGGIQQSIRKTKTFPYAPHKVENVISLFIAGMIFLTTYELTRNALFQAKESMILHTCPWVSISLECSLVIAPQGPRLSFLIDRIGVLIMVLALVKTGWDLLVDGMCVLLDAFLDSETLFRIREAVEADPRVGEVREVLGRNAGQYRFVEIEVALRVENLKKADEVGDQIQARIREAIPNIEWVLIHPK